MKIEHKKRELSPYSGLSDALEKKSIFEGQWNESILGSVFNLITSCPLLFEEYNSLSFYILHRPTFPPFFFVAILEETPDPSETPAQRKRRRSRLRAPDEHALAG